MDHWQALGPGPTSSPCEGSGGQAYLASCSASRLRLAEVYESLSQGQRRGGFEHANVTPFNPHITVSQTVALYLTHPVFFQHEERGK